MARRQEQQQRVRAPIPDGFIFDALRLHNALRDADLVDGVAAQHPRLRTMACLALPQFAHATCSQSVLAFATQLTKKNNDQNTHALLNRVQDLTVPQMRRTLERLGLGHFPIYILQPFEDEAGPRFIAARGTKHREDNWAIVYVPEEPNLEAHWTFTKIQQAEQEIPNPHVRPILMYTEVPLAPRVNEFWRARVNQNNVLAFMAAREAGRACSCDINVVCQHEQNFLVFHPQAVIVSFLGGVHVEKTWRAQALKSPCTQMCADYSVKITNGPEVVSVPYGHSCDATMDVGNLAPPYSIYHYALFHRARDSAYGTGTVIEIPEEITQATIGGIAFRLLRLPERKHVFGPLMIALHLCSPILSYMCYDRRWFLKSRSRFEPQVLLNDAADVRWNNAQSRVLGPLERMVSRGTNWILALPRMLPVRVQKFIGLDSESNLVRLARHVTKLKDRLVSDFLHVLNPIRNRYVDMLCVHARRSVMCVVWACVCAYSFYLFYHGVRALYIRFCRKRLITDVPLPRDAPYGHTDDLTLQFPEVRQLQARLATLPEVTSEHAFDLLRRLSAESNWLVDFNRAEVATWIERVVTVPGKTRNLIEEVKDCVNCRERPRSYRMLCKTCWSRLRNSPLIDLILTDSLVAYVGMLPMRSQPFVFPVITALKDDCTIKIGRRTLFDKDTTDDTIRAWYARQHVQYGYRGRNCGPLFLRQRPSCFPRGHETAVVTFCLRLGTVNPNERDPRYYRFVSEYLMREPMTTLEPESREYFLSHFSGEKLEKMLEAERQINLGNARLPQHPQPADQRRPECHMKGFTKAEKSYRTEYEYYYLIQKPTMKPRFICCPNPEFLFTIGPYTHAQTKWLSRSYRSRDHLFYAGCSKPADLNDWLNFTHHDLGGHYISIADDISAIDACHSEQSMDLHTQVRRKQFPNMPRAIEALYLAEHALVIKLGKFTLRVNFVNGSGVSDTSYKNSLLCLFLRLLAMTNAVRSLDELDFTDFMALSDRVRNTIYTTASGDDGLTRTPRNLLGVDLTTIESKQRYSEYWKRHGFGVKVKIYSEVEWRMATYLANRPVYVGNGRYEWMPEPARRLRGLFWQIDNSMHPMVWGRSVATGLQAIAAAHPVLGPIADWYLENTKGPVVSVQIFGNPYNPFQGHFSEARTIQQRAISEFLVDYNLMERDYSIFLSALQMTKTVFVNFETRLIHQLFRLES